MCTQGLERSPPGLPQRHPRWEPSVLRLDVCTHRAQLLLILLRDTYECYQIANGVLPHCHPLGKIQEEKLWQ